MECSRDTKDKMFKGKNQTEENIWLLKLRSVNSKFLLKVNILRLKFFCCFTCLIKIIRNQSFYNFDELIRLYPSDWLIIDLKWEKSSSKVQNSWKSNFDQVRVRKRNFWRTRMIVFDLGYPTLGRIKLYRVR